MSLLRAESVSVSILQRPIFNKLDLTLEQGQCWGILGANGAGKTTLLHVLAGLRNTDAGRVSINGNGIDEFPRKELAKQVGILFQDCFDSFPVTVMESVLTGRYPHLPYWAMDSAEDVNLCMQALTEVSLSDMADREVQTLSGGERRRLALATLMVQAPRIWLLDEPTNHLDLHYQISLLELIVNKIGVHSGGLLMVLHDVNLLTRFCSHALLMIDADTRISGELSEVITRENLEALYRHPIRTFDDGDTRIYYPV
jgi:iron complex transport system ATP-binding protein